MVILCGLLALSGGSLLAAVVVTPVCFLLWPASLLGLTLGCKRLLLRGEARLVRHNLWSWPFFRWGRGGLWLGGGLSGSHTPARAHKLMSSRRWWIVDRLLSACRPFLAPLAGTSALASWYRLLGAKIGSCAVIESTNLSDCELLTIGDGAWVGQVGIWGSATCAAHRTCETRHCRLDPGLC